MSNADEVIRLIRAGMYDEAYKKADVSSSSDCRDVALAFINEEQYEYAYKFGKGCSDSSDYRYVAIGLAKGGFPEYADELGSRCRYSSDCRAVAEALIDAEEYEKAALLTKHMDSGDEEHILSKIKKRQ